LLHSYDGCAMSIVFSCLQNERFSATVTSEMTEDNRKRRYIQNVHVMWSKISVVHVASFISFATVQWSQTTASYLYSMYRSSPNRKTGQQIIQTSVRSITQRGSFAQKPCRKKDPIRWSSEARSAGHCNQRCLSIDNTGSYNPTCKRLIMWSWYWEDMSNSILPAGYCP